MHASTPPTNGFKRQVVFRLSPEDWPLLQHATTKHGSIQAAVLAGLRALEHDTTPTAPGEDEPLTEQPADTNRHPIESEGEEIRAREAAQILGIKPSTVAGYIRTGRLPGHYDPTLKGSGWLTTRHAVQAYKHRTESRP